MVFRIQQSFITGFQAGRSTNDNSVRLETFIRDAFVKKEHVVAVFFDLEKAYDTTWRYGIMKDIHKLGLRGRLPTFIESFLADRAMQVRVGSSLSDLYDQEQGVPQGPLEPYCSSDTESSWPERLTSM